MSKKVEQAALNNALWCDAVCRAHGRPGEFLPGLWLNRYETPRFYPNGVTLKDGDDALALIQQAAFPSAWAVKDSFCALDLAPLGFRVLFEAEWLYRAPLLPLPRMTPEVVRWGRIRSLAELAAWEEAWAGEPDELSLERPPRIFLPALLADESIAIIAAYQSQQIVAGAIANRTDEVVGLSNVFTPAEGADPFWAGCIASAMDTFPALPLVGYERGEALDSACALGFEPIGVLRVWLKES